MSKCEFWIALPDSTVSEVTNLRDKTVKIGLIGRVCAVFGVQRIYIYHDPQEGEQGDLRLMKNLLEYMETPQYLRRRIYRKSDYLAYVGLLPPLRTPHHKLETSLSNIKVGEYREGITFKVNGSMYVDCGLASPIPLKGPVQENTRVTVRFISSYPNLTATVAEKGEVKEYWGFRVKEVSSLGKLLRDVKTDLFIFTSRNGDPVQNAWGDLVRSFKSTSNLMIVFGSPKRGIYKILADEKKNPLNFTKYVLNTIPDQSTETVRIEEALFATLSLINLALHL